MLEDASRRVLLSESFPDLVRAEKEQEWAGIVILPPATDVIIEGLYGTSASDIPKNGTGHVVSYPIPTKHGSKESLALNWPYFCDARDLAAGLAFLCGEKRDESEAFRRSASGPLPPPQRLPAPVGTIETVRIRAYRSGFNIKFLDAEGNGADPPEGTRIELSGCREAGWRRRSRRRRRDRITGVAVDGACAPPLNA